MKIPAVPTLLKDRRAEYEFFRAVKKVCSGYFTVAENNSPVTPTSGGLLYVASVDGQDELFIKFADGRSVNLST